MKTKSFPLIFAAILLACGSRSLAAGSAREENLGFRKLFLDLYVEGVSEASEREAARALRVRLSAATYDLNHDGKLDAGELAAWEKEVRIAFGESPRALKKYDLNHDRKLDDAEWAVARRELLQS